MQFKDVIPQKKEIIRVSQFQRQNYLNVIPKILYSYFPDSIKYKKELLLTLLQDERLFNRAKEKCPDFDEIYKYVTKISIFQELIQYYNAVIDSTDIKNKDKEIKNAVQKIIIYSTKDKKPFFFDIKISNLLDFCIFQTDLINSIPSWEALKNAKDQRKMPYMISDIEYEKKGRKKQDYVE